jgi:dTDP-4-amino-4,6-dideoxygalactose transaminase
VSEKTIQLFRPRYEVDECLREIRTVLESGWTGQGPRCSDFEKAWRLYTGAAHSHFVNSATSALHIAVRLLDLPKGSVVATTPLTFVSSNAVILYENHVPLFCDCGEDMSLSFKSVREAIEKQGAKAVMWVHYGGNISEDFYELMDYVKGKGISVIEDCAHASGASYDDGTMVGSRQDTLSCWSFHAVKNLPIMDGGMLCTPTTEMDTRARKLSWMGIDKSTYARTAGSGNELYKWSYNVPELGWKYNGNDIAAAIGLVQLKYLDRDNAYRRLLYEWYQDELKDAVLEHQRGSSHHLLAVLVPDREKVIAALKANGIAPGVHYLPNYEFPVFKNFSHSSCERVEKFSGRLVSLPNHLNLTRQDVRDVCAVVKGAWG